MLTSIIIELLGTKLGEFNETIKSSINLIMNMKATMQLRKN